MLFSLLLIAVLGQAEPEAPAAEPAPPAVLEPIRIPGSRVSLLPLPGFALAETFAGLASPELNASILVVELPAPFAETSGSLSAEGLDSQGIAAIGREETTIAGAPAVIVSFPQTEEGVEFRKWAAIFGNEIESVLLTASYPAELDGDIGAVMKGALLSAAWSPEAAGDPFESMPFTVAEPLGYKVATRLANSLLLTEGGVLPESGADAPVLLVGYARSPLTAADKKRFAQDRLVATEGLKNPEGAKVEEVEIDGLPAVVIEAAAVDMTSETPIAFYQAILFGEKQHYVIQGSAPAEQAEALYLLCGNALKSFKRKAG